jgi:hypothetical protein
MSGGCITTHCLRKGDETQKLSLMPLSQVKSGTATWRGLCRARRRKFLVVALGRCVSFQITILKVLAGSPDGRLPLVDLRHDVALLMTSGRDWTDRMKRIAARAPDLDIFSQAFVVRESTGWQITAAGRYFLATVEKPAPASAPPVEASPLEAEAAIVVARSSPLIGINPRRQRRRRRRTGAGRAAVA